MRAIGGGQIEETVAVALDPGEDVLEGIAEAIQDQGIVHGAVVSGVGSLSKISYHIVDPGDEKPWKDTYFVREGTIEVMAVQGLIVNGQPHLHITASQGDKAFGGHLEPGCIILTLAEILILKLEQPLERRRNDMGYEQLYGEEA